MTFDALRFGDLFLEPQKNGLTKPKKIRGSGVPMVNMGELFAHRRIKNIPMDLVPIVDREKSFFLKSGDLLFARQSLVIEGAGQCAIFQENESQTVFESHLIRCRLDPTKAVPEFYFYFFQSPEGQSLVRSIVEQGAGASGIRGSDLVELMVPLPPIDFQSKAAAILTVIDDQIDQLKKINTTLLKITRAIYKSWFVDLEVSAEFGEDPRSWKRESIYEIADVIYGAPFSSKKFNTEKIGVPLIRIRDLKKEMPGIYTEEVLPRGYLVQAGDIVVGMDGEFRAYIWGGDSAWLNQRVCVFVPKNVPKAYLHLTIEPLLAEIEYSETATTVIHLGKNDIDEFQCLKPSQKVLDAFGKVTDPIYEKIVANKRMASNLVEIRDLLIPKIISGAFILSEIKL